jgi:uncharacterized protein YkwD
MTKWLLGLALVASVMALILSSTPGATRADVPTPTAASALVPPVSIDNRLGPAYTGCGNGVIAPVVNADYEQQVVELVNAQRALQSLPPYKRVTSLDQAARYHATDMAQDNYFAHDSYDRVGGSLVQVCAWSSRISSYYSGWQYLAENIAAGYSTPQSVMNGWMNSSGHRANILSPNNWEIGVGYYQGGGDYGVYWVQDFGRRSGIYPLVIANEAASTNSRNVPIYIYGSWQDMRLQNDSGAWTAWQPFQSSFNWTLGYDAGERTVTAQLRSGSTIVTSADSINLVLPILSNVPDTITFLYSIADQKLIPTSSQVTPAESSGLAALTWDLTTQGTWFTATPTSGTTPASFFITPTNFVTGTAATYTGAVTVTVTSPTEVVGSPHRTDLTLIVVDSIKRVYLPVVLK